MTAVAPETSAAIVAAVRRGLAAAGQAERWDIVAAHPFDDPTYPYVIRGARLGPGPQPFTVIYADCADFARYPELVDHWGAVVAQALVERGRRFDNPGIEQLPQRMAAWGALHGH